MLGGQLRPIARRSDESVHESAPEETVFGDTPGGTVSRENDNRVGGTGIRVLLVDDHTAFRQALALAFSLEPDLRVVAHAESIATARDASAACAGVDVAIVDLDLPDGHGVELIRELRDTRPDTRILALTASVTRRDAARAMEAGAAGFLSTSASLEETIAAVRRLAVGEWLHPAVEMGEAALRRNKQVGSDVANKGPVKRRHRHPSPILRGFNRSGDAQRYAAIQGRHDLGLQGGRCPEIDSADRHDHRANRERGIHLRGDVPALSAFVRPRIHLQCDVIPLSHTVTLAIINGTEQGHY